MSLQHAAKYLASKGRGEDSVLIHMTPREVDSLQALAKAHGGTLTTNPHTGLPEAGFLSSILPMVAGAALTPFVGPMGAAMIVGGVRGLQSGSLSKGVMAGLGAYGGAGIGEGLANVGAESIANQAVPNVTGETAGQFMAEKSAALTDPAGAMSKGLSQLGNAGGFEKAYTSLGSNMTTGFGSPGMKVASTLGAAAAPMLLDQGAYSPPAMKGSGPNPYNYTYEAGLASPFPQADARGVEQNYFPNARYVPQPTSQVNFAQGGLSHLGDYSDGGRLLRGPGDGVSDSIPAVIGNKQPARLADGEFVIPARIVSELGNGSTEAGARKLYAMMDRVQAARGKTVGKGKVAKNSRADKYLPA